METKHTPGPWHVEGALVLAKDGIHNDAVAQLMHPSAKHDRAANARLIAAAPELLEALDDVEMALDGIVIAMDQQAHNAVVRLMEARDKARAAIAKATGEA